MATTKAFSVIAILACVLSKCDAKLTGWTIPNISAASGTGTIKLPENTDIGTTTITLLAVSDVTPKPAITYDINPPSNVFTIEKSNGTISLKSKLNYETTNSYKINVTANDNNGTGTASITISIGNVNPEFPKTAKSVCMPDGSSIGTQATTVKASLDAGTSGAITYSLAGNGFAIDKTTGVISSTAKLDKNSASSYTLTVTGTRAGAKATETAGTETVKITVGDCSAASLTSPFILFTLLITAMSTIGNMC